MREIDGLFVKPDRRLRHDRMVRAQLWVDDQLIVEFMANKQYGGIWVTPPGIGPVMVLGGRRVVAKGARPLYRGRWPDEAKDFWRMVGR